MEKFLTPLILILLSYQTSTAQCGIPTNTNYYFNSSADLVFDWDDNIQADTFIIQFKETYADWSMITFEDTVYASEYVVPNVCSIDYIGDWRVISRCANSGDTTATLTIQLQCLPPTSVSSTNVLSNSAILSWTPVPHIGSNCTGYALAYRAVGASNWTSLGHIYAQSYQLNNLQPSTTYEWCVNQLCLESTSAPILGLFTTASLPCNPPSMPTIFGFTNTSLNLTWSSPSSAPNHQIQYKLSNATTWTTITTNSSNFYNLTGLTPSSSYNVRVARLCSANNASSFSPTNTFVTNCVSLNNSTEHIRYVKIKDKIWTSTANPGGYLYGNWNQPPTLTQGVQYTVSIGAGGQVNNSNRQDVAAYLDANNNQIFESSELIIGVAVLNNTSARNYNFTVPTNMPIGSSRIRIVMLKQNQTAMTACPPFGLRGEVEDYIVTIVAPSGSKPSDDLNSNIIATLENEQQNPPTQLVARCKDFVTKYLSPFSCTASLDVSEIDNGSEGYDSLYYSGPAMPFINEPNIYKLKAITDAGDGDYCFSIVTFLDTIPPVAVLTPNIVMTFLTTDSIAFSEQVFDQGSYDQCTALTITMDPPYIRNTDQSPLNVIVTVTDSYGNSSTGITEVEIIDKSAGSPSNIANDIGSSLNISPNPSSDWIQINAIPESIESLVISNTLGQLLWTSNNVTSNAVNISSLVKGKYFVTIVLKDGSKTTTKLVKN
jgi:hypothetical protein